MTIPKLHLAEFTRVRMDLTGAQWWTDILARPGWYAIETNAPISVLADFPLPEEEGLHYRIAERLRDAQLLVKHGDAIVPEWDGDHYVVYSGECADMKARARQHTSAGKGTGCLSLKQYDLARDYIWTFYYRMCGEHMPGTGDNKTLRSYLEQVWRAENGWPVLCLR